jgi:predicted amidohydrolase
MKAHLVQLDIAWEQPRVNHQRVRRLLSAAGPSPGDCVLLPEMFDTGFSMNTGATADRGGTLAFLHDLAAEMQVTVQGGRTIAGVSGAKARNVMTIVAAGSRAGTTQESRVLDEYTKVHPFSLGQEHVAFEGGSRVTTYEWAGGTGTSLRVCPAICYDLRFPELFRIGLDQGAQGYALGACWPKARQHHWRALLIARAIENQACVMGVNRVGTDPNGAFGGGLEYVGGSIVVGPTGEVLGELGAEEGVLSVEIDPGAVKRWREKFPAWKDRKLGR